MIPKKSVVRCARGWLALLFSVTAFAALAAPLRAQGGKQDAGFRIGAPRFFLGGHIGFSIPNAGGDLFNMVTRELTLKKSDFRSPAFGVDFGVPFRSRFAAVISFDYSRVLPVSESRNFVEDNGDPVGQKTEFSQMPITATLRFYPIKTGERVGSYAWIPRRVLPYVGAGGGIVRYTFKQNGDFVDTQTLDIFTAELRSSGVAATGHLATGIDFSFGSLVSLNAEARYSWAKANLSRDFTGFKPIDLSGLRLTGGVFFRF